MSYIRKTRDEWVIEQDFGYGHGWEEVCSADNRREALDDLKSYRENQPKYPVRMRKTRVKLEPANEK